MICCEEGEVHVILPKAIPTGSFVHCCSCYVSDNELLEVVIPTAGQHFLPGGRCGCGDRDHSCTKELVM